MIESRYSSNLEALLPILTEEWEAELLPKLPFPIAYRLGLLREGNYGHELLCKDMIIVILRYLALIGMSDYFHTSAIDTNLNDRLKRLKEPMTEGKWHGIVEACAARDGDTLSQEYREALRAIEMGRLTVSLSCQRYHLSTVRVKLLGALVTVRNKLVGHNWTPSEQEKKMFQPIVLNLVRAALHTLDPLWKASFVATVTIESRPLTLLLHGTESFEETHPLPAGIHCALRTEAGVLLPLEPLAIKDVVFPGNSSFIDTQAEVYLLEALKKKRIPSYVGCTGGHLERSDLEPRFSEIFDKHKVFEKRMDIELNEVLDYARKKSSERLDELYQEGFFDLHRTVPRQEIEETLCRLLNEPCTRALFVAGASGSGKTTALLHWLHRQLESGVPALILKADELSSYSMRVKELRQHISDMLATEYSFADVLQRAASVTPYRFLLVVDGMNEFTGQGRDGSKLFEAVRRLLEDVPQNSALRLIVSARSDCLGHFLPKRKGAKDNSEERHHLPENAEEDRWLTIDGQSFFEVPPLSIDEAEALVLSFGAPPDYARELAKAAPIRTPDFLCKSTLCKLEAADLRKLDARDVTSSLLELRLGKDGELRSTVYELVKTMGRNRELTMTEEVLEDKAPKLHERLRTNGDRLLRHLRELRIVKVVSRTNEITGEPTWALALAHDSLFEALRSRQQKSMLHSKLIFSTVVMLTMFIMMLLAALGLSSKVAASHHFLNDAVYLNEIVDEYGQAYVDPEDFDRYQHAWHVVKQAAEVTVSAVSSSYMSMMIRHSFIWLISYFILFASSAILDYLAMKRDRREIRMLFFGREDSIMATKHLLKYLLPITIISLVWTSILFLKQADIGFSSGSDKIAATLPLLGAIAVLLISIPLVFILTFRRARRGSPLLWDYHFSEEGVRSSRRGNLRNSFLLLAGLAMIFMLTQSPMHWYIDTEMFSSARSTLDGLESQVDWVTIKQFPVIDKSSTSRLLSGVALAQAQAELFGDFNEPYLPLNDSDNRFIFIGLSAVLLVFLGLLWVPHFVIQIIACRIRPLKENKTI